MQSAKIISTGCDFCSEFAGGHDHLFAELVNEGNNTSTSGDIDRILHSSEELRLLTSLGEIEFGHTLICPTYHATAFNRIRANDKSILPEFFNRIETVYFRQFGCLPSYFEHGDPTGEHPSGSGCIHHAHLHVLPRALHLPIEIQSTLEILATGQLENLPHEVDEPYILIAGSDRRAIMYRDINLPRQFLRSEYCKSNGFENRWHWAVAVSLQETLESTRRLKLAFMNRDHSIE